MKFSDLENICNGQLIQVPIDIEIKGMAYDSRQISVQSGTVFFAISGDNHDGHLFITDAHEKGIRFFVIEQKRKVPADAAVLLVDSSIAAMQAISAHHRMLFDYPVIGVTGSNGKTIVKEWMAQLLDSKFDIVKSPKSFNSQLGVPLSVWGMKPHQNLGIFEAGISEIGEMDRLEKIIQPTIGIFTNIGEAHNAGFESLEQKAREKAVLFRNSKRVLYCKDQVIVREALERVVADAQALIPWQILKHEGKNFHLDINGKSLNLQLKFEDPASIENSLHCAAALTILGFGQDYIQIHLSRLSSVKMRLEMKQAVNRSYVIDDTYNNDLYGLEVAIDFLARQNQRSKKSVILSDLYQTGLSNEELYARVNELLQKNKIHRFIGIGKNIRESIKLFHGNSDFYRTTDEFLKSGYSPNYEVVLVKGARDFAFESIVSQIEQKSHGTVLEVNLENFIHNLNFYRSKLKAETKIMVMVKAFAYGGGNFEIANLLQFHQVDYLGVAYIDEAVELRKNGIHIPIMIMNVSPNSFRLLKEYNLELGIYGLDQLIDFLHFFKDEQDKPSIHLKLETGMNRLGFKEEHLQQLVELLKLNKGLKIRSIFSHLARSEDARHADFTQRQSERFDRMSAEITELLRYKPLRHLVNTGGVTHHTMLHYDMVRLGIGLHGFDPTGTEQKELRIVSTLKCVVSQVKKIKSGESVGYGRSGLVSSDMMIAIIPIGYADGYLRAFGNGVGRMLVNGKMMPTIGNICMDMCMIDVSDVGVKSGDEVIVFGEKPTISDLALWINTIPYEILTNISQRVKRVFLSE